MGYSLYDNQYRPGETPRQRYKRQMNEAAAAEAAAVAQEQAAKKQVIANVGKAVNKTFDGFLKECESSGRRHEDCVRYAFKASESLAMGTDLPQTPPLNRRSLGRAPLLRSGGTRKGKARKGRKSYRKRK